MQRDIDWKQKYDEMKQENDKLKMKQKEPSSSIKNRYSYEFWEDVRGKCVSDPDYVKSLVRNKKITMKDVDGMGQTLLMKAAYNGSYDIVQLCINSGADIHQKDYDEPDGYQWGNAINYAQKGGFSHVEQLLTLNAENANLSDRISSTADIMNKQNGFIENILSELKAYDSTTKEFFEDTLKDITIKILDKSLIFSDDVLNLVWRLECDETDDEKHSKDPLNSNLWKCIQSKCKEIIASGSKKEWEWFKQCVIPSSIWLKKTNDGSYLYYELLKLVNDTAKDELNELEQNIKQLAKESELLWDKLVNWSISTRYDTVRQDHVPNGVKPEYSHQELVDKGGSSATFNPHAFYDHNQYLAVLQLTANIVDDEFHESIQQTFNINKDTHIGTIALNIEEDEMKYKGSFEYQRGPVKAMERARSKAENDYIHCVFPSSACVLDFNRCSLVFRDIETLLSALELFTKKVKYYQSGNIIDIVRYKNGFKEYIIQTQYADIKLNVLIKGEKNTIIGEVQFLLKPMVEFKKKAHNLYAIQRQEEYVENAVSKILPMLLDEDKQLFVAAELGSVKSIANIMNYANKTETEIMKQNDQRWTILHCICKLGNNKALSFIKSLLNKKQFIDELFKANDVDSKPIEYCIRNDHLILTQQIFSIDDVKKRYLQSDDELYRLIWCLFAYCNKEEIIDLLIQTLNIKERISTFINYQYAKTEEFNELAPNYHHFTIIGQSVPCNNVRILKKLVSIIGEKLFVNGVLQSNAFNQNAIECGVLQNKVQNVKYLFQFEDIQERYAADDGLLFRLLHFTFAGCNNDNMIDIVMNALDITNKMIVTLLEYKYQKESKQFDDAVIIYYHLYNLVSQTIYQKDLQRIKKMVEIIGVKAFTESVFVSDGYNMNGLEYAIEDNKLETMKYMMQMKDIKERMLNEKETLWRFVWWMNSNGTPSMVKYLMETLQLNEAQLKELQSYECKEQDSNEYVTEYWTEAISDKAVEYLLDPMNCEPDREDDEESNDEESNDEESNDEESDESS